MRNKITLLFCLVFTTAYCQDIIVDITDKPQGVIDNPAYNIRVIEPISDTIYLNKKREFTLIIEYNGELNSFHIIDYPTETFADINNLEGPETNEEYLALSTSEQAKYSVVIPKHEILKEIKLTRKIILEIKITSNKINKTDIYTDGKLIKTLYYFKE